MGVLKTLKEMGGRWKPDGDGGRKGKVMEKKTC